MRRRPALSVALALVVPVLFLAGVAGAHRRGAQPLAVRSASLTQDGQQLVWTVTMNGAFSAVGLKRDHRSLCLTLERHGATHRLCVGRGRRRIALFYDSSKGWRVVTATISRSATSELTATFMPSVLGLGYDSLDWQVQSGLRKAAVDFPSRPKFARLHVPRLVGCVPSGSSLVYSGSPNQHDIALSFDDGPWPTPPATAFISLLAHYHAPATFFEIGRQIPEFDPTGSIERSMLANGDMIGNHTWTHPDMAGLAPAEQTSELEQTQAAIKHATGFTPCLWRPPYGSISPSLVTLARSLGLITVMWNIDPRDWSLPGVGEIEGNIIENARNGGITEMHFGGGPRYETLDALPDIITTLRARGFRFVTLTQMLGLRMIYK
jgi:peptidoglycan-N-acetylglucosamine deacetylase